jgi:capsular exopolysaccharide synthesis family protein
MLVDADMRRPTVHKVFELDNDLGLSNLLQGELDLDDILERLKQPDIPNLTVLPAGPEPARPAELLASPRMRELIARLAEWYYVILDTPALLPVSDATALVRHVDQVLLVVGSAPVRTSELQQAWSMLQGAGAQHLSLVVNRYQVMTPASSYYYRADS